LKGGIKIINVVEGIGTALSHWLKYTVIQETNDSMLNTSLSHFSCEGSYETICGYAEVQLISINRLLWLPAYLDNRISNCAD